MGPWHRALEPFFITDNQQAAAPRLASPRLPALSSTTTRRAGAPERPEGPEGGGREG